MNIALPQAVVGYRPALLSEATAKAITNEFLAPGTLAWRCDDIRMFGRRVAQPRLTVWVADPGVRYSYCGICLIPQQWTPLLLKLRSIVEQAASRAFNSVLINQYRNGHDYVGWHSDNEPELGPDPVIASLSLGAARLFELRHRDYRDNLVPVQRFNLLSRDLIVMRGPIQQYWKHRVPKQTRITDPRINLSFRMTNVLPDSG